MRYITPQEALPEMGYHVPEVYHNCGSCRHSEVSNAGAVIPGLHCNLMEEKLKEKGIDGMEQVNSRYGSCNHHTALQTQVKPNFAIEAIEITGDEKEGVE